MDNVSRWWNESFITYAVTIAKMYLSNPEQVLNDLKWGSVVECLNESYQSLIREKAFIPIEELPEEKKNELWQRALKIAQDKKRRIQVCRAIYLLEKITDES